MLDIYKYICNLIYDPRLYVASFPSQNITMLVCNDGCMLTVRHGPYYNKLVISSALRDLSVEIPELYRILYEHGYVNLKESIDKTRSKLGIFSRKRKILITEF